MCVAVVAGRAARNQSVIHPGVVVRGDLAPVSVGRYCLLGRGCVLRPSYKRLPTCVRAAAAAADSRPDSPSCPRRAAG